MAGSQKFFVRYSSSRGAWIICSRVGNGKARMASHGLFDTEDDALNHLDKVLGKISKSSMGKKG
jgi:hypothetical protein